MMNMINQAKKSAAIASTELIKNGHIIGLGSGSTATYMIEELGRRIRREQLKILAIPTSIRTAELAVQEAIPLTTLDEHPKLDIAIDGADQVDDALNMIKGMGGALTREKIVASASKLNIIMIDERKLTKKLGDHQPVPVEVMPFAWPTPMTKFRTLGGNPVLRQAEKKLGPVVTDNGNFLVDVAFGSIDRPNELNQALNNIPGIIETGLFLELAHVVYVGGQRTVRKLIR